MGRNFNQIFIFLDCPRSPFGFRPGEFMHRCRHPRGVSECWGGGPGRALLKDSKHFWSNSWAGILMHVMVFLICLVLVFPWVQFVRIFVLMLSRCLRVVQVCLAVWVPGAGPIVGSRGAGFRDIQFAFWAIPACVTVSTSFRAETLVGGLPSAVKYTERIKRQTGTN